MFFDGFDRYFHFKSSKEGHRNSDEIELRFLYGLKRHSGTLDIPSSGIITSFYVMTKRYTILTQRYLFPSTLINTSTRQCTRRFYCRKTSAGPWLITKVSDVGCIDLFLATNTLPSSRVTEAIC